MEKPGTLKEGWGRIWVLLILPLFFFLFWTGCFTNREKKMETGTAVKGYIVDKTGKPVEDAIVMVKSGDFPVNDIASVSNGQGEFFVPGIVTPGRYVLEVQHGGATITREINVPSPDTIIRISF